MFNDEALNAAEAAALLHIGRNAVYALAKTGELPSYRLGRKLLFSLKDVQAYLESKHSTSPSAQKSLTEEGAATEKLSYPEDAFVIAGQGMATDFIVECLQSEGAQAMRKPCSSYAGLVDIYKGRASATLVHLYDQRTNSYNIPYVQRLAPGTPVTVFRLIRRWQGFAVAKGNPHSLSTWSSLLQNDVRLANRSKGSGSRVLLDEKLLSLEANPWSISGYGNEYPTGLAAGSAVASGVADVAIIGEQAAAQIEGIDFVRMQPEWLDVVVAKHGEGRKLCRAMKALFADASFKREYSRIVQGQDDSLGAIIYEC